MTLPHPIRLETATLPLIALLSACTADFATRAGPEVQAYPAGVIPGVHVQLPTSPRDALTLRAAANITDRKDYGEHDDEEGEGYGAGIGWRHYAGDELVGWLWGARLDLWAFEIDWRDDPNRRGSTDTLTLQPAFEAGYAWSLSDDWWLDLTASLGAEINVDTDGEDVGEGAIFLLGFTLLRSF